LQNVARGLVELADDGHRWQVVVLDRGGFTQEFRVDRDAEVDTGLLARAVFEIGITTLATVPGSTVLRTTMVWRVVFSRSTKPISRHTASM
jgi:hypothetical protein